MEENSPIDFFDNGIFGEIQSMYDSQRLQSYGQEILQ
jgi:hypothetical protein